MTQTAYWLTTYAADRRKHRHRCRRCSRIVQPGEQVYMARVGRGGTKVLHVECAAQPVRPGESTTELELLECHGMSYLARCGSREAQARLDANPLTRTRPSVTPDQMTDEQWAEWSCKEWGDPRQRAQ